jgi:hypothetical protein
VSAADDIAANLAAVRARIAAAAARAGRDAAAVRIVGVTKRHPDAAVERAWAAGLRDVGENFAQELLRKRDAIACAGALRWHFIGRLQTNKVKAIVGKVALIHAVDSERLAREIDRRAAEAGVVQDVLVAVNLAGEDSKSGVPPGDVEQLVALLAALPAARGVGLMAMPPLVENPDDNRAHFAALRALRDRLLPGGALSMGTTADFEVAVEEGATLVRVGTALFGERPR